MAKFQKFNILKYIGLGLIAGLIAYVVSFIYGAFNIPIFNYQNEWVDFTASTVTINLREQIQQNGQFGALGQKVLDFMTAHISGFNFLDFATILFGAVLLVLAGRTIVSLIQVKPKMRVFLSFIAGGLAMALFATFMLGMPFVTALASILAYSLGIAIIVQILIAIKLIKFLEE